MPCQKSIIWLSKSEGIESYLPWQSRSSKRASASALGAGLGRSLG